MNANDSGFLFIEIGERKSSAIFQVLGVILVHSAKYCTHGTIDTIHLFSQVIKFMINSCYFPRSIFTFGLK